MSFLKIRLLDNTEVHTAVWQQRAIGSAVFSEKNQEHSGFGPPPPATRQPIPSLLDVCFSLSSPGRCGQPGNLWALLKNVVLTFGFRQ